MEMAAVGVEVSHLGGKRFTQPNINNKKGEKRKN